MMRKRMGAVAVAVLALAIPGNSCGPFFTEMVFFNRTAPADVEAFLNGHLGVVQGGLTPRYLALSYRILSGPALTPQEKASELEALKIHQNDDSQTTPQHMADSIKAWTDERVEVEPAAGDMGLNVARTVPGQDWANYSNCLGDAFVNAARTLAVRARDHAAEKAALADWVQGQDAVFSNCPGNGDMPSTVSQPIWLAQDRAYQIAAAHFYRSEFGPAQALFQQIAADGNSPWRSLAAYMVGRCLLRQATLSIADKNDDALLRQAAAQFRRVMEAGGPYADPAGELLNFAELRFDPSVAAARLGDLISRPDPRLEQHLVDLVYVSNSAQWLTHQEDSRKSDLIDWALNMKGFVVNRPSSKEQLFNHAKDRWHQTGNVAWLVAAMTHAQGPDEELTRAANSVSSTSPAWVTLTYVRLNALPASASARAETEKVLSGLIARHEARDTVNQFTILARKRAESLAEFAKLAPLEPVGWDDGEDGFGPLPSSAVVPSGQTQPTMAGLPVNIQGVRRLDEETARVLNRDVPLKELVSLVLASTWPKQLRFELAMAVWSRAVLLDRPQEASSLTPAMVSGEPGWKQWLAAYDAATTHDERRVTGLLALMRFPSVRPYVNAGAGREEGFVGYSSYRDNWWCADMGWFNYSTAHNYSDAYQNPNQLPAEAPPAFATVAMETEVEQEQSELEKIGDAPEYFGTQALAWVKTHPKDPRNAELLGFAFRAMRNGCNLEKSFALKREVFTSLHTRYPKSEWAKKYPVLDEDER